MGAEKNESRTRAKQLPEGKKNRFRQFRRIAIPLLLLLLTARVQAQSALDGFDPNANGTVRVAVVQPDGKILIGGDFTALSPDGGVAVTRNHIARLNLDGTLDNAFNPNANGFVYGIALQADGKILVAGSFNGLNSIGGQTRDFIARLDATTGLADSFNVHANAPVTTIAVQADGKILVGGQFDFIGGTFRILMARLDPTTGLADSFDPHPSAVVNSIAVQTDGKILAGGSFTSIGGQPRNHLARLDATTGLADSFDPNANAPIEAIAVQADGKILVGGDFNGASSIGGQARNYIARLDGKTGLADLFDPNANTSVLSIAVQADGKIVAGGAFASIGGQTRNHIARLDPLTGLADSFDPNANLNSILAVAVQADGKILAVGDFTTLAPNGGATVPRANIARLETDGRADQTLNTPVNGLHVDVTVVQPDGKILIGGDFSSVANVARSNVARLNPDGTLDTVFNPPQLTSRVHSIAFQSDGKILVGGDFYPYNGIYGFLIRLDATTGSQDDSFHPSLDNFVYGIAVQADGKILIAGGFSDTNVSRLNPDGTVDPTFNPNANGGAVLAIAIAADNRILLGGNFTSVGGQTRNGIARLNPDGTVDMAFDPNANNFVESLAVQADGKILTGGNFTSIGGQTRNNIARLDAATGAADSLDPSANGTVYSIVVQADSKILVGGEFNGTNSIGGQTRNFIARLDATTGLADSFDPNAFGLVNAIALQADGKILAGGGFSSIGGESRLLFARLLNDTAALQDLAVTQSGITWTRAGSSPQFSHVTFESSTDNTNYTPLGDGTAAGSNWTLTGLHLPTGENLYVRARGSYRSGQDNASESVTEFVRNAFLTPRFANISTRVFVLTGDHAMIGGFIVTGTGAKTVIVRGIGPSLPLLGALADPVIEVHGPGGELLATNDNWITDSEHQHVIDNGLAPTNDLESALWMILNPGAYTVIVRGKNDATGIGLFEVYDVDQGVNSRLANISTRGYVDNGIDSVIIGGIIISGTTPARVLLRAIGPSLTNVGILDALRDPRLELHNGNGTVLALNDNWRSDQEAEIIATTIPPSNDLESAIVQDLAPGRYTAIVLGMNNTFGIAVVEAYDLN